MKLREAGISQPGSRWIVTQRRVMSCTGPTLLPLEINSVRVLTVTEYFLQRMKTKWGSCNPKAGHIRLNTELVRKPGHLLEYVLVHEMAHLLEPTHNERCLAILNEYYPAWHEARAELNELPLSAEQWKE